MYFDQKLGNLITSFCVTIGAKHQIIEIDEFTHADAVKSPQRSIIIFARNVLSLWPRQSRENSIILLFSPMRFCLPSLTRTAGFECMNPLTGFHVSDVSLLHSIDCVRMERDHDNVH